MPKLVADVLEFRGPRRGSVREGEVRRLKQEVSEKNETFLSQDLSITRLKSTLESVLHNAIEIRAHIQNYNAIWDTTWSFDYREALERLRKHWMEFLNEDLHKLDL